MSEPELSQTYDPKEFETKWYKFWIDGKFFEAPVDSKKIPYTILMPPPNVTSQLHMGHGTTYALQDILVRWKRMRGYNALWLPGTDHAGIATQMMLEKQIEKDEGKTRHQIGRTEMLKRLEAWKDKYGGMITDQFRSLGFSCDWSKEAYTMDPHLSKAVRAIFVKLYKDGMIYRGERLVNWDPILRTAISDDEIESVEMNATLWHFNYPIQELPGEFIGIATTRPETMLGDTAVAVNPTDDRYKHLVGKHVKLPFTDRLIPIIADEYVAADFGTGCVKITPAHDVNDFEMGKRHKLPMINVMNEDATMADNVPARFKGLDRFVARKEIVKGMKELGLFIKDETHRNAVPHSDRSKAIIEPRLSLQWFVNMKALAKPAIEAANNGDLQFHPSLWKKTYLHWLENIQDWCISRQIWWGHRIPIWYCQSCQTVNTGMDDPTSCSKCQSKDLKQDEDVLDTWFSSWLWPISPFGWPEKSKELDYFYPTNTLVTANEILFLWVARMVMVGLYTQGKVPFKDVYIAATICDKQGKKFSKTLGNGIDPLDVIAKHGTDALRFTGIALSPLGGRVRMEIGDFEHGARFVNKIWNAARFLFRYTSGNATIQTIDHSKIDIASQWLLEEFARTSEDTNRLLDQYRVNEAVNRIYHFVWGSYCDWGLECAKESLNGTDETRKAQTISVLVYVFDGILKLFSPVMPFVTEELWHKMPKHPELPRAKSLVVENYPVGTGPHRFASSADQWARIQELIVEVRSARALANINPKDSLKIEMRCDQDLASIVSSVEGLIKRLVNVSDVKAGPNIQRPGQSLVAIGKGFEAYIPALGLIDIESEKKRLSNERDRVSKVLSGLTTKMSNPNFVDRAPEDVIVQTKEQIANMQNQLKSLEQNISALS
ncbi:MAG: valine--tRNA ligase [Proteobacteria bacterium]|nr:valine--tRNA ligase [Pseudomonadota bacterium]